MDFVGDVLQRFSRHVSPETLSHIEKEIRRDFGGSREYIASQCVLDRAAIRPSDALILRDRERGLSVSEIAARHGMTRQGVYKSLKRSQDARRV